MSWILVLLISTGNGVGVTTAQLHFLTEQHCEAAGRLWAEKGSFMMGRHGYVCLPRPGSKDTQ